MYFRVHLGSVISHEPIIRVKSIKVNSFGTEERNILIAVNTFNCMCCSLGKVDAAAVDRSGNIHADALGRFA